MNWETRKLTWKYDWAWLVGYVVTYVGFMAWTIGWRHKINFDEVAGLLLAIAAANLVRGWLIVRAESSKGRR